MSCKGRHLYPCRRSIHDSELPVFRNRPLIPWRLERVAFNRSLTSKPFQRRSFPEEPVPFQYELRTPVEPSCTDSLDNHRSICASGTLRDATFMHFDVTIYHLYSSHKHLCLQIEPCNAFLGFFLQFSLLVSVVFVGSEALEALKQTCLLPSSPAAAGKKRYIFFGYGIPLLIAVVCFGLNSANVGSYQLCMLKQKAHLLWISAAPFMVSAHGVRDSIVAM